MMSYAERTLRKKRQAKTPAQLAYGRCYICWERVRPCGPSCWHRRHNRCHSCTPGPWPVSLVSFAVVLATLWGLPGAGWARRWFR